MKLNSKTIDLLKNFSSINSQILLEPGKVIRTKSSSDDMLAYATIEDELTEYCGIHDLSRFVGVLSIFVEPEVEFTSKYISISNPRQRINYTAAPREMIKEPLDYDVEIEAAVTFELPWVDFNKTVKATNQLGHTDIVFRGSEGKIMLEGTNCKDPTSDTFSLDVGKTDKTFSVLIPTDRCKLMSRDYTVSLSNDSGIRLVSPDLTYYIAYNAEHSNVGDL